MTSSNTASRKRFNLYRIVHTLFKKLRKRFFKFTPTDLLFLWVLIICGLALSSWFGANVLGQFGVNPHMAKLGAATGFFAITLIIVIGRFYNMQVKAFVQILSVLLTAGALLLNAKGLFIQNGTLKNTLNQSQLMTRPLVSISLVPRIGSWGGAEYFGGSYIIQNSAAFPATHVQVTPVIYYDTGQADNFEGWYGGTYGAYPDIRFIGARAASDPIISMPSVKSNVNFASIVVLVNYQGFGVKTAYWQIVRKTYRLHWAEGKLKEIYPIEDVQK